MADRGDSGYRARCAAGAAVVVGLLAWLWPIGTGGRMPVGGDVTNFSIGLMAELGRALRAGRIPYWNDLWGYGFPGLAESQMGVYYPPHLVLYGLLPVEWAYTASLVLHTLWAGLGAMWASRRFGVGVRGSAVTGLAWGTCGFFLVHLPHHWGATTASWMPWAWGLAWSIGSGSCRPRAALRLAAVLTLQILPGHFQLAFITQVTSALLGLCGLATRGPSRRRRLARLGLAMAAVVPLGLMQLEPTAELAEMAGSRLSRAYLGAFASPPVHLVSYVAPGLFHESPLWRPLAWDALHAMPEEHLATVGLVPLFLACVALRKRWRDPSVRALAIVALAATWLSLGPYVPGFSALCRLPGFAFFRAPARWGSAAMLALAILAGRGFDAVPDLVRPGRALRSFVLMAAAWVVSVIGLIEVAVAAHEPVAGRPAWPGVAEGLGRAFRRLPWPDDPSLARRLADARRPLDDSRVPVALARRGRPFDAPDDRTLTRRRVAIYAQEVAPTYVLFAVLFAVSFTAGRRPRAFEMALLAVLVAEAGYWSRRHPFDLGPIRPLADQSPVLARVATIRSPAMAKVGASPRGIRWAGPGRNLPMVVAAAPIAAYRTLDLPVLTALTDLAGAPIGPPEVVAALRATGVGVRVAQQGEPASPPGWEPLGPVDDPTLLGWLTGADWVRALGERAPTKFDLRAPPGEPARAWFVSMRMADLARVGDDPRAVSSTLASARPLALWSARPEDLTIVFEANRPGAVVLSQLWYPRWRATLSGPSGEVERPATIARAFDGWQAVEVPSAGPWTIRLTYDVTNDRIALGVSGLAWLGWGFLYWRSRRVGTAHHPGIGEVGGAHPTGDEGAGR